MYVGAVANEEVQKVGAFAKAVQAATPRPSRAPRPSRETRGVRRAPVQCRGLEQRRQRAPRRRRAGADAFYSDLHNAVRYEIVPGGNVCGLRWESKASKLPSSTSAIPRDVDPPKARGAAEATQLEG